MKIVTNPLHRTKIMESITTGRRTTTAHNRFLTTTTSAVQISIGLSLVFAFKSISFHLIAILVILCAQGKDCNAIPLSTSLILPPPSTSLASVYLSSVSSDNAATGEHMSFDRVAAAVQVNRVVNVTRQYAGDVFSALGKYLHYFLFVFISINCSGLSDIMGHIFSIIFLIFSNQFSSLNSNNIDYYVINGNQSIIVSDFSFHFAEIERSKDKRLIVVLVEF